MSRIWLCVSRHARTIATAVARTAVYYKRTALIAGVIGLAGVLGSLAIEDVAPKGAMLGVGALFGVFCFTSLRRTARYLDPDLSPALRTISHTPERVTAIVAERAAGKPSFVVVTDEAGDLLRIRVQDSADVAPLLDALAERCPNASVER